MAFSGCFEENKKETANLQLSIDVLNYQHLTDEPIEISIGLKNTGDKNYDVEEIIIPDNLQLYITTPEGFSVYCTNISQNSIPLINMPPGNYIYETFDIKNLIFGNETMTFDFSMEGIYSIKAVYKNSLESNTDQFKIRKASTFVMTAQQFIDDAEINLTDKKLTIDYKSLDYGDKVTLNGDISDIVYLEDEDITQIKFTVEEFQLINHTATNLTFYFIGNITSEYKKQDNVNISFHIEWNHWFSGPQQDMFEYSEETAIESELDTSSLIPYETYVSTNFPGYLLPNSCISNA